MVSSALRDHDLTTIVNNKMAFAFNFTYFCCFEKHLLIAAELAQGTGYSFRILRYCGTEVFK